MVKNPTIVTKTETSLKSTKFVTKISQIQYTYGHLNRANINNSFGCAGATLFALFRRHLVVHEVRLGCNLEGFLIKQDTTEMFLDNKQLNNVLPSEKKKRNQAVTMLCLHNELRRCFLQVGPYQHFPMPQHCCNTGQFTTGARHGKTKGTCAIPLLTHSSVSRVCRSCMRYFYVERFNIKQADKTNWLVCLHPAGEFLTGFYNHCSTGEGPPVCQPTGFTTTYQIWGHLHSFRV